MRRKKTMIFIASIAIISLGFYSLKSFFHLDENVNLLILQNIEALTLNEGSTSTTQCPPGHVPDRYLLTTIEVHSSSSNKGGSIDIGGDVSGDYKSDHTGIVVVEVKNCNGEKKGSCCDQSLTGARILK